MKKHWKTITIFVLLCTCVLLYFNPLKQPKSTSASLEVTASGNVELPEAGSFEQIPVEEASPEEYPYLLPVASPDGTYSGYVTTVLGNMIYYNQHDTRWSEYLWGGSDPLTKFGCGPTALAMIIGSFTDAGGAPPDYAQWADENRYRAPGSGSNHNLIPEALRAYGLEVQSLSVLSADGVRSALEHGKILVALMGKGHFTQGGHFIIITGTKPDGSVTIADPQSYENTLKTWDPALIINEVKPCGYGGPVWAVSN